MQCFGNNFRISFLFLQLLFDHEAKIELLYPCHCVSLNAKVEMAKELKINEVGVGLEINV